MGRYALLVATWEYVDPALMRLRTPAQDVSELAGLLRDPDIGGFDDVQILRNDPRWVIEEQIEELFAARKPDDVALLYLSCHGQKNEEGRLYFAALQTKLRRLDSTAISARFVHDQVSHSRARGKVVLLDCCCSGAFTQEFGLTQQVKGRGSYVITASDELEYALEGNEFQPRTDPRETSVFTRAVVDGLRTGLADTNRDGVITAEELFRFARQNVTGQTPQFFDSGGAGEVQLAKAVGFGLRRGADSPFGRSRLPLGKLFSGLAPTDEGGLAAEGWPGSGQFVVPVGRTYEPGRGWEDLHRLRLTGGTGNLVVAGKPFSGKTALLSTLVCALALTHSADDLQVYCLRDRQEGLAQLAKLPHVGQVAPLADAAECTEVVQGAAELLARRQALWEEQGFRSLRAYRASLAPDQPREDPYGDVFVVIDPWQVFEDRYPQLVQPALGIARHGLRYGIHLAVSVERWPDLPDEFRPHFGSWLELALDQPRESRVDRERAATLPHDGSGFGLTSDHRYVQVAFPELADHSVAAAEADEWDGLDTLVRQIRGSWSGPAAPPLRTTTVMTRPRDERQPVRQVLELPDLLGVSDPGSLDVRETWAPRQPDDRLRVPFGTDDTGRPILLDIKESAQGGMGPHGLIVGATGSGKSELLRTLLVGLAVTNPPDELNFVLVDFKGGATFLDLERLPHTSAVVTNLAQELPLVDRMLDVLSGEVTRRQELLRAAGNFASQREYQQARAEGVPLEPLPSLLLVVDEFGELLATKPDFISLFVQIGRLGRSLGMHMLLASQRLEEGKLRGLDAFLSYRFGLRTFSASESRVAIGVPDAYELPRKPGSGFLKVGTDVLERFQTSYAGATYAGQVPEYARLPVARVLIDRLAGQGAPARQIWLPPLDEPPTLDALLPPLKTSVARGLHADWDDRQTLQVPVGMVDEPYRQRRDALWLDLSGPSGHVGICGSPQSGKSTLLRTLLGSLALTHTPAEVGFYCLDFGGGALAGLTGLPHVGGVAARTDPDAIRRTVAEMITLLEQREQRFTELRIDSIATYRQLRGEGRIPPGRFPADVFLVVDGWATVRADHEAIEAAVTTLAVRGLGFGIHVVATATRWNEFRAALMQLFQTKLELRLSDPYDSEIDRRMAANVPENRPGRGLSPYKQQFLGALPRIDGRTEDDEDVGAGSGVTAMVEAIALAWREAPVAPVRRLPESLPVSALPQPNGHSTRLVPIGVDEDYLDPVYLDFDEEPHLFVTGSSECGKSNLLTLILKSIVARYSPKEARIAIVDYRRSLLESITGKEHLIGYAPSGVTATEMLNELAGVVRKRLPGPEVTPEQLRTRWWSGSDLFVVVDDYELVATPSGGNPLSPFADLVSQARDLGLHLIIARGFGGVGRAMYEPIVQRIRDLSSPALIMSGTREEGRLFGVMPQPFVPGRGTLVDRRLGSRLVQTAYLGGETAE